MSVSGRLTNQSGEGKILFCSIVDTVSYNLYNYVHYLYCSSTNTSTIGVHCTRHSLYYNEIVFFGEIVTFFNKFSVLASWYI